MVQGYCIIVAISIAALCLNLLRDSAKHKAELRFKIGKMYEPYKKFSRYTKDIRNWAAYVELLYLIGRIPFKVILYSVYSILIFTKQINELVVLPLFVKEILSNFIGIEYISVLVIAIDRLISALKNEIKDDDSIYSRLWKPQHSSVFRLSRFYVFDKYDIRNLKLPGSIMVANIDAGSVAYRSGICKYDILVSFDDDTSITRDNLNKISAFNKATTVKIATDKSNYKNISSITIDV
ncbi:MAG: hypothetical protein LBO63_06205 [Oscillospiraceae bacterium]|jgi:hypothetical protein|nr:hypothetical protein [Oscillospiraceae bacterium]